MSNGLINTVERVEDIPLLLAQMKKIELATLLGKHFPMHGHWKGLSLGHIVEVWLAYILSEGDHRPDLPQLKINQSALDPLGIPLTTTISFSILCCSN